MKSNLLIALLLCLGSLPGRAQKITEYLPQRPATIAIVVCPGGSYCWLSKKTEGSEVALWLTQQGFAAYVLEYPVAGWAAYAWHTRWFYRGHQHPDQLRALEKAVQLARSKGYRHVGAMGFSAGGHLVLNGAEWSAGQLSPDFIAPIYPVVTMSSPCVHRRSRRGLLGERRWRNRAVCDSLSMERHADRIHCPVFMINCADDPVVNKHNAELMDSALTAHGKPHLYRQYATGGHGFGASASKTSAEAIGWKQTFVDWVRQLF